MSLSQYGDKPIHFACSAGKVDMLHLLIKLGSSENSTNVNKLIQCCRLHLYRVNYT